MDHTSFASPFRIHLSSHSHLTLTPHTHTSHTHLTHTPHTHTHLTLTHLTPTHPHTLQKRHILEQMEQLEPRVSALEEDLSEEGESEEEEEEEEEEERVSPNTLSPNHSLVTDASLPSMLISLPLVPPSSAPQAVSQSTQRSS